MSASDLVKIRSARRLLSVVGLVGALSGCATLSPDGGFGPVAETTRDALGREASWQRDDASRTRAWEEVRRLLAEPLTADSAMQVSLLTNPTLQARYAELGVAEAEMVQAGRLPNPGFSFSRITGGGTLEIERGIELGIGALLTMPMRLRMEQRAFERARHAAAMAAIEVAMQARRAFVEAVAAREAVHYQSQVLEAAEAGRDLMSRMTRVGNASRLDLARELLGHAEAVAALTAARERETATREALVRVLGLYGPDAEPILPERLPPLPEAPREERDVERRALEQRLDVQAARAGLEALAADLDLTRVTRFVDVVDLGAVQIRERGEPRREGYEIHIEVPLLDWGDAKVARAEARYLQAVQQLRAAAVAARSQVRETWSAYRTRYDLARHYRDAVLPLRKRISDEQLLRYNGMLTSVFDLLADARGQAETVSTYIEALRAFWLADTALRGCLQNVVHCGPDFHDVEARRWPGRDVRRSFRQSIARFWCD